MEFFECRKGEGLVIGDDGEQMGTFLTEDAIRMAQENNLDLVEVAPTANPPVCRIMDFGKFKYKQSKKAHEAKKNQKVVVAVGEHCHWLNQQQEKAQESSGQF